MCPLHPTPLPTAWQDLLETGGGLFATLADKQMAANASQKPRRGPDQTNPFVRGIGGAVGGITEACMLQPMDVIKTRLQLDKAGVYQGSLVTCGRTVAQQEGVWLL